jgi:transposase
MDHVGIDLHKRESQICIETADGEVIEKRIRTERGRFIAVFGARPRSRILVEAMTESEWVARCLEELGHEVIVADPNYAAMYATRSRRVKTDRRDATTLADACRLGAYRPAHRASDRQRHIRAELAVRDAVVHTRVKSCGETGPHTRSARDVDSNQRRPHRSKFRQLSQVQIQGSGEREQFGGCRRSRVADWRPASRRKTHHAPAAQPPSSSAKRRMRNLAEKPNRLE